MAIVEPIRWEECSRQRQADLRTVWRLGDLSYKLHGGQIDVHAAWRATTGRVFCLDCARRFGKTFWGLITDVEAALKNQSGRVPVAAPEQKQVREIIVPILQRYIFVDCPPEFRPTFNKTEGAWTFPSSGSRMIVAGLDKNPDALRGVYADHGHIIEAAFVRDLEYVVQSIVMPQFQGRPHARLVMESTPPTSPLHAWSTKYVPEAKASGNYAHKTIEDNPLLSPAEIEEFNQLAGGRESTTCRRENYAEHVVDADAAIVPEFRAVKAASVREQARPEYYDAYVAMDPGQVDLWAVLFGHYDFTEARLVVEDEVVVNRQTTSALAAEIEATERRLWGAQKPYRRVSDTEMQVIYDLAQEHKLHFVPTAKDDKLAALNVLRLWVQRGRVIIHPRCTTLISHLEFGVWNERRTDYERVAGHGHFDCIDALVYMVRNVDEKRNPYPALSPQVQLATHFVAPGTETRSGEKRKLEQIFGGKFVRRR